MATISRETRNRKSVLHKTDLEAFKDWVKEYAEANDMEIADVLDLALFRLEKEAKKAKCDMCLFKNVTKFDDPCRECIETVNMRHFIYDETHQ